MGSITERTKIPDNSLELGDRTTNLTVAYQTEQTDVDPNATITITDADRHLQPITVTSSPLQINSDSDDLSDTTEAAFGLSPSTADTDQDTIDDDTEINNQWYARLHDFRPPRIQGHIETDGNRVDYRFEFTVQDQSRIGSVTAFKGGKQRASNSNLRDYRDGKATAQLTWHIDRNIGGQIWQGLSGYIEPASARAMATDVHGNEGPKKKYLGPNNFGKLAGAFGKADILGVSQLGVAVFSTTSGFAQGVNVFKNDIITTAVVVGNPNKWDDAAQKTVQALNNLKDIATSSKKRQQMMAALVKHYGDRRQQLNPFEQGSQYEDAFAVGYSGGYAATFIVPIAAEAKAAQVAAKLPYMAALMRSVGTVQRSIKGVTIGSAMWTGGKIAKRMPDVDIDVARRVPDVEVSDGAKRLIGKTADTLGNTPLPRQQRILELTKGTTDGDVMDWMTRNVADPDSSRYQRGLVYLRRTGAQGKELLSKLDEGARKALLRMRDKAVLQRQLTEAYASGDIDASDVGEATRRYDGMDAPEQAFVRKSLRRSGDDGVDLLSVDVCNSPCQDPVSWAFDFAGERGGLDNSDTNQFLQAVEDGDDVSVGPGTDRSEVLQTIDKLASDDVDGIDGAIGDIAGSETGYKQIAGEANLAKNVQGGDVDAEDVTMERDIPASEVPDNAPLSSTEVDVDVDGEITVEGETLDSPAVESKHFNPDNRPLDRMVDTDFEDLQKKLTTQALAGEDEILVVTTRQYQTAFSDRFDALPDAVRQHPDVDSDVTVKVTTYNELQTE